MAQINPSIPIIGNPVSTEEPKVKTAIETIVAAVNSLDDGNIAAGANINGNKLLNASVDAAKLVAGILPPSGALMPFAGSAAPTGYLICDGSAISRTTYGTLFSAIGTSYGTGDGSTTFNLPDLRGRMPVGKGTHVSVDALGENDGAALANRRPAHSHAGTGRTADAGSHSHGGSIGGGGHEHTYNIPTSLNNTYVNRDSGGSAATTLRDVGLSGYQNLGTSGGGGHSHTLSINPDGTHGHDFSVTVGSTGGTTDAPSFVVVNYIIKT